MPLLRLALALLACVALPAYAELAPLQPTTELERPLEPDTSLSFNPLPGQEVRDEPSVIPTIDLTASPDDLWQRIRNGFGMPDLQSPLVADRQAWYLNRPEMLKRIFERSRRYLHHIVEELEKRGMPSELALLPIVESAFNPTAYSRARAMGIWQFIPSTGKNYRLEQNWWLDQRRDIVASTSAALDYLQNIYEMHGDWHLALASYNWGEHAVARAVAKNQAKGLPTDYASLTMPGETRYYVPKLQAIKNIVRDPALFGFTLDPIPNRAYFGTVDVDANMDIALAARLAETSIDEFIALNPAYHRPVMPGKSTSVIALPAEKLATFLANLERYEAQDRPLSNWHSYALKKGEKIDAVAVRHGLSGVRLRQLNGITARTKIGPGFTLLVPTKGAQVADPALAAKLPRAMPELPKPVRGAKGGRKGAKATPVKRAAGARIAVKARGAKPAQAKFGKR